MTGLSEAPADVPQVRTCGLAVTRPSINLII